MAAILAGGCALLLGRALAGGERHRILVRGGVAVIAPRPAVLGARIRAWGRGKLSSGRSVFVPAALGVLGAAAGSAIAGPAGGVAGLAAGVWVPRWRRRSRASRHAALVQEQLADAMDQLQHRVGGDAPAVLDDAVRTLRQRVAAAAELRSLTAQAKLSGTILGLLPIGFFLFMSVVSRSEVAGALSSSIGLAAVAFGLLLDGCAFLWIRHLLRNDL
jgi:Flp pilus assembly protein TadB